MNRNDILETIRGLGELYRDGFLSDLEFQREKNELLAQLREPGVRGSGVNQAHDAMSVNGRGGTASFAGQVPPAGFGPDVPYVVGGSSSRLSGGDEKTQKIMFAAEQGHPDAQCVLGCMYREGKSVVKNPELALEWLKKAAAQGSMDALFTLAMMLHGGEGVEADHSRAFTLFNEAATLGHSGAQFILGYLYYEGKGVRKDNLEAVKWLRRATESGHKDARKLLDRILKNSRIHLKIR